MLPLVIAPTQQAVSVAAKVPGLARCGFAFLPILAPLNRVLMTVRVQTLLKVGVFDVLALHCRMAAPGVVARPAEHAFRRSKTASRVTALRHVSLGRVHKV